MGTLYSSRPTTPHGTPARVLVTLDTSSQVVLNAVGLGLERKFISIQNVSTFDCDIAVVLGGTAVLEEPYWLLGRREGIVLDASGVPQGQISAITASTGAKLSIVYLDKEE